MSASPARARGAEFCAVFEQRLLAGLAAALPVPHPLCVAFSGGIDSTVLIEVLARAGEPWRPLRALHVDHGLSAQARRWNRHCREVARRLHVPLTVRRIQVPRLRGRSPEALAREARYRAFSAALRPGEVLVCAQHADDQLETVLLQLLRGAGLPGLAAMPVLAPLGRGLIARPLLGFTRAQIERYAHSRSLEWCEDDSNADERFDRNYLRRRVVPVLAARWPGAARALGRSAQHAAEAQRLIEWLGRADAERCADGAGLEVARLRTLGSERRRNALRSWISARGAAPPDSRRLAELAGPLLAARADAQPAVRWGETVVAREGTRLILRRADEPAQPSPLEWCWGTQALIELPAGLGRLELAPDEHGPVDTGRLPERLTVRWRRGGERLRPRPGGPRRALKHLMQEARLSPRERARVPLIYGGEALLAAGDLWVDALLQPSEPAAQRARFIWHRA